MTARAMMRVLVRWGILLLLWACVDPFSPPEQPANDELVVIDGFLDVYSQSIVVGVFHAELLDDLPPPLPFADASVFLEDDASNHFELYYAGDGHYQLPYVPVQMQRRYRILVQVRGESYVSDFVEVKTAPPVDSLTYQLDDKNLSIYVNTHDDTGRSEFFRWEFDETWAYRSRFYSGFEPKDGEVVPRSEDISNCWLTQPSRLINLESTETFTSNVVRHHLIASIPLNSIKLNSRYSILVRQFALTSDEFVYWKQLAATTEQLGTLFDAQPTQVIGNVREAEGGKIALGYFSAGSSAELRLTISAGSLPNLARPYSYGPCGPFDYDTLSPAASLRITPREALLYPIYEGISLIGYAHSSIGCADCRLYGGTTQKPDYW